MNIKARALTNKIRSIPVPIPGEEITTGISWSYVTPAIYYTARNQDPGTYQPVGTYTVSANTGGGFQYTEYGTEGNVPCKVGWHKDLYADRAPDQSYRYISSDVRLTDAKGSVTLSFSGLPNGKYVVVIDHWIGCRSWGNIEDETRYFLGYSYEQATKTVKQGTHGIVYGELIGIEKYRGGAYEIGTMGGIHVRQSCNITINEGEISKLITYGDDSFSFSALAGLHHYGARNQDMVLGAFYSCAYGINPRLYTDGRA